MKKLLDFLRHYEPARLAGIRTAALGLAVALGLTVSPALDAATGTAVGIATLALTLLQTVLTRGAVYSPATVNQIAKDAYRGGSGVARVPL